MRAGSYRADRRLTALLILAGIPGARATQTPCRRPASLPPNRSWQADRKQPLRAGSEDKGRRHQRMGCPRRLACVVVMASLAAATGCTSSNGSTQTSSTSTAPTSPLANPQVPRRVPSASGRVVVRGNAVLDGTPFDSPSVGAVVLRAGLVTPCQYTLPPVTRGRYAITVLADTESSGCGAPGAQIVLWTFAHNEILYSTDAVAWPSHGHTTNLVARYSTAAPAGASPTTAQFTGGAFGADGRPLLPGTRIDAYVGGTRCGTAGVRYTDPSTEYILAVVGPDSIAGCTRGAPLTFRIDGRPAAPTSVVNTPPGQREALDLTLP
jgi:hypothetical protein